MKKFLDKTFNLAGLLRGLFIGLAVGLILWFISIVLGSKFNINPNKYDVINNILGIIVVILSIVFAVKGALSKPIEISDGTKKWVGSTRSVGNISMLSGKGVRDSIFPEQITIRKFLIWFFIYLFVIILGIAIAYSRIKK